MDHKERIRAKAEARLARLRPNTGHARLLRARLGISDAPVVEEVVEPVVEEVVEEVVKPRKRRTKKSD